MRLITQRDGDLSTHFDVSDEKEDGFNDSSLDQILLKSHTELN